MLFVRWSKITERKTHKHELSDDLMRLLHLFEPSCQDRIWEINVCTIKRFNKVNVNWQRSFRNAAQETYKDVDIAIK